MSTKVSQGVMENTKMIIGVDADDLAEIIDERKTAQQQLRECMKSAQDSALEWRDLVTQIRTSYERFRHAVQEATGLDQPALLSDEELVARIRTAAGQPYATFSIDGWTGTAHKLSPDAERRLKNLPTVSLEFEGTYEAGGPPATPRQWKPGELVQVPVAGFVGRVESIDAPDVVGRLAMLSHASELGNRMYVAIEQLQAWDGVTDSPWRLDDYAQTPYLDGWRHGVITRLDGDKVTITDPANTIMQTCTTLDQLWPWSAEVRPIMLADADGSPAEDHQYDAITYARMIEREQDGPATETMPAIEHDAEAEAPETDPEFVIGRRFTRGDTIPAEVFDLVTRLGDVWRSPVNGSVGGVRQYFNDRAQLWRSAAELLHMHGTLWELRNAVVGPDEPAIMEEQILADDEDAADD